MLDGSPGPAINAFVSEGAAVGSFDILSEQREKVAAEASEIGTSARFRLRAVT